MDLTPLNVNYISSHSSYAKSDNAQFPIQVPENELAEKKIKILGEMAIRLQEENFALKEDLNEALSLIKRFTGDISEERLKREEKYIKEKYADEDNVYISCVRFAREMESKYK